MNIPVGFLFRGCLGIVVFGECGLQRSYENFASDNKLNLKNKVCSCVVLFLRLGYMLLRTIVHLRLPWIFGYSSRFHFARRAGSFWLRVPVVQ